MNIVDVFLIIGLIAGAIGGLRRGLVRGLIGLAGLIIGAVAASQLYRPLSAYLETQYAFASRLASGITPHLPLAATVASTPVGQGTALADAIQGLGLPALITQYLSAAASQLTLPSAATIGQALALGLSSAIAGVVCFLGIFFVVQVAAALLAALIGGAIAVTPLRFADRLIGAAVGFAWSGVFLVLLVGGLGLLSSVPAFAFVGPALSGSSLVPAFLSVFEFLLPMAQ